MSKLLSWEEIYDKLNIEKMISRSESAESAEIRFSKFDNCHITGFQFKNGEITENRRYNREVSTLFEKVFIFLQNWGLVFFQFINGIVSESLVKVLLSITLLVFGCILVFKNSTVAEHEG